ncbi:hypothetical protein Acr_00g0008520 [Actinidia rufa]|uniref:Uncharacterized protein n=1 Tax=Actinidia rufa TaxID=165716 RepID=A0A7J0DA41_9ERIC|nr:hypothetical protein Acr_00g0008520 [Actinidia rufa]
MVRFKTLGQKKTMSVADPPIVVAPPISQVPPPTTDPILALAASIMEVRGMSSAFLPSSSADAELWKLEFCTIELSRQRAAAISNHMKDQLAELKRAKRKMGSLKSQLNKAKLALAGDNYDRQVAELHPRIFMEGWLACLTKLSIPENNPTWAKVAPVAKLPESLEPYSPMILPCFNEEYMNQPVEEDGIEAPINKVAQPIGEVPTQPAEEIAQPMEEAKKIAIEKARKDAAQGPPPEL